MPPEDAPIESWSGASREEIILLVAAVLAAAVLALAVYLLRRWLSRRRELRSFFAVIDGRALDEQEEEAVRKLAMDAKLRRPTEIVTSIATFDSLAETALRDAMRRASRDEARALMDRLYSARAKLFPQGAAEDAPGAVAAAPPPGGVPPGA